MKAHTLKYCSIAVVLLLFSSCTNMLFTSLDVLRPAKVAFKTDANNLLIVNNAVIQPAEYGHNTELINQPTKNVLVKTDSLAIFCLSSLNQEIQNSGFFNSVKILPNSINTSSAFFTNKPISLEQVDSLCSVNTANVLISFDKIIVTDDLNEFYNNETSTYLASLEVKVDTRWSIHYPNESKPESFQFEDTMYWESESYMRRKAMGDMPVRSDALIDAALSTGSKMTNRLIPYWEKVDRYFYNPNYKLMKQGMDSVYVKNWDSAIVYWDLALNKTKSNWMKSQAANNIAIAYEILGNIDKAIQYAALSFDYMQLLNIIDYESFARISNYYHELLQRKDDMILLKIQMGE